MFKEEKYNIEFKERVTDTFLKTVSAYANYNQGEIIFGVADGGTVIGINTVNEDKLRIENMINDTVDPVPTYKLEVVQQNDLDLIQLTIMHGQDKPYYYKGKAYKRADTSTVPVDRQELNRLVLEGMNLNFEDNKASNQLLTFNTLEEKMIDIIGIEKLSTDILKTLNLYDKNNVFNVAAELLSDQNAPHLSGIDMVKFGSDTNKIQHRDTFEEESILKQYDQAIKVFERYYQFEEISGYTRTKQELIPGVAFREALSNAVVHREWDIRSHIQIALFDNRVEINSPGGLPLGMSEESYLHEQVSNLRNPIIASVFNRLNLIEAFGTGVRRIREAYENSYAKPEFHITANNIKITLPLFAEELPDLIEEERAIYQVLGENKAHSRTEIENATGYERSKVLRNIKTLIDKDLVIRIGSGPSTVYKLKI